MSKPTKKQVQIQIRRLRRFIDGKFVDQPTAGQSRVAYAMEEALRWTIEDTEGWDMLKSAKANGELADQGL